MNIPNIDEAQINALLLNTEDSLATIVKMIKNKDLEGEDTKEADGVVSFERMYAVIKGVFESLNNKYQDDLQHYEYFSRSNHFFSVFKRVFRLFSHDTTSGVYANCVELFEKQHSVLLDNFAKVVSDILSEPVTFHKIPAVLTDNQLNFARIIPIAELWESMKSKYSSDYINSLRDNINENSISGTGFKFGATEQRIITTLFCLIKNEANFSSKNYHLEFKKRDFLEIYSNKSISGKEWSKLFKTLQDLSCKKYLIKISDDWGVYNLFDIVPNEQTQSVGNFTLKLNRKLFFESNRFLLLDIHFRERIYKASKGTRVCEEMDRIYIYLANQNFKKEKPQCLDIKINTVRFAELIKESNIEKNRLNNDAGIPMAKILLKFNQAFKILKEAGYVYDYTIDQEFVTVTLNPQYFHKKPN